MSNAQNQLAKPAKAPRILVIVGNDLVGDSRVQKIIRASIDAGKDTWVLSRKPKIDQAPEGLESAHFLRIPFDPSSHELHIGYGVNHDFIRLYQQIISAIRSFLRFLWTQLVYRLRRSKYHLKRGLARLVYSPIVPRPLHGLRAKLLLPRREKIEEERAAMTELRRAHSFENRATTIVYPNFADYLQRMYSWFVNPAIKSKPDLIHANDADTLRIAIAVKDYWAAKNHRVAVVYDSHEYTAGVHRPNPTWMPAMLEQEATYLPRVDAVMTVSEEIASMLKEEFSLPVMPAVVVNAPSKEIDHGQIPFPTLRESLALENHVPLFTYVGVAAPARGIHTVVEALPHLPHAHFALVTRSNTYVQDCLQTAADLGVADRVHLLPYVPHQWVSAYIADSTAGINPAVHHPNHELSCSTKYYEYIHAQLPIVMSDLRVMARVTRETNVGEVFVAEDAVDCARAMELVASSRDTYTSNITDDLVTNWSWEKQAQILEELYDRLLAS